MKIKTKKTIVKLLSIVLMMISLLAVLGYAIPTYINAEKIGKNMGDKSGEIVGDVIGSYNGITKGIEKGAAEGKEKGLSNEDTLSKIKNDFSSVGNLEVLNAGVKLQNVHTLGEKYAALFLLKGVAIYSVDLQDVEINENNDGIVVLLPDVIVDLYIDENATEKLAEYQKYPWSGSAEDGYIDYMNSRDATDKSIEETLENYDSLMNSAEEAAKRQVGIIARSATGNNKNIEVLFKKEVQ